MLKWASLITVIALVLGVVVGAWIGASRDAGFVGIAEQVEYIGVLWLNALKMTIIPLVFSLLVTGIASVANAAATGKLAARSVFTFGVLLASATTYACIVLPLVYSLWPVDASAAQGIIAGAGAKPVGPVSPPTIGQWIAALAPPNPVAAAADTAVLPLVVFAIIFGFAATRLPAAQRDPMIAFFRAVADTMIVIVRWVLVAAPIGVFALSLGVGLRSGADVVGLLIQYVSITSAVTASIVVLVYLFALLWGRVNPRRFIGATAPVLAVAIATRSSLASLPLMVERTRDALNIPVSVANVTLPLAVAIFRMTSPVANLAVVFFSASVFGVELGPMQIIAGGFVAIAVSIGSVSLPGEISFVASVAPISIAMGVPIELLGILVGVEAIPDTFRTMGNVSADMAATAIANRSVSFSPPEPSQEAEASAAQPG
jgi:proton glutamate symport protein